MTAKCLFCVDASRALDQLDAALALVDERDGFYGDEGVAVFRRNTKLFLKGDVVVVCCNNGGGERWPVYGRSGRGYSVAGAYAQGHRWRLRGAWDHCERSSGVNQKYALSGCRWEKTDCYGNKSAIALVEMPKGVRKAHDDDVRSGLAPASLRGWFVRALRAGHAASQVGSGSLAFLPLQPDDALPRSRNRRRRKRERDEWAVVEAKVEAKRVAREAAFAGTTCSASCGLCGADLAVRLTWDEYKRVDGGRLCAALVAHRERGCAADCGWQLGEFERS